MSSRLAKVPEVRRVARVAVVDVISRPAIYRLAVTIILTLGGLLPLLAAVLPEDRADALYHSYKGGGIEVNGPSILIRKMVGKYNSLMANYYVDSISSASIDVVTSASPYTEHRTEKSLGLTNVNDATTMNLFLSFIL